MKAREYVAQIARSTENRKLVEIWKLLIKVLVERDTICQGQKDPSHQFFGELCVLVRNLTRLLNKAQEKYLGEVLKSCQPGDWPGRIYANALDHNKEAVDAFLRAVDQQMPEFAKCHQVLDTASKEAEVMV